MTDAHEPNDMDGPHEGPIKTPKQLILAVFLSFVVPIFGIVLLVMFVTTGKRPSAGSEALDAKAVAERIRPVGMVEVKDMADFASMKSGEQVFAGQCTACHTAGALGAPKFGDAAAWAPRIATGYDNLLHSALAGKGQMPPQGGGDYSDFEIGRAVVYMANKGGATFAEPAAPAASGAAAAADTATSAGTAMAPAASAPAADANTAAATATSATPAATTAVATTAVATTAVATAAAATAAATPTATTAATTTVAAAPAPALFGQVCTACHSTGAAGAPKLGDKVAWAPRIAQGVDALTASAIKGKGAMPPRGGSGATDAEIKAVVTYMVAAAK